MSRGQDVRHRTRLAGLEAGLRSLGSADVVWAGTGGHAIALDPLRIVAPPTPPQAVQMPGELLPWLRLGLSEWLRDRTVERLRARRSGETTVLLQQMVRGQLAEAVSEHLELAALLSLTDSEGDPEGDAVDPHTWAGDPGRPDPLRIHRRITDTDRLLLRCFGAAGFEHGGVGEQVLMSERLVDVFGVPRYTVPAR